MRDEDDDALAHGQPESTAFLDVRPPHWAVRGLAYLVALLFVVAVVASVLVEVPEAISGPIVLVPERGADPIRSSRTGVVSEIHVREGETVEKEAIVFVIASRTVGDRTAELRSLETQANGLGRSLVNLAAKFHSQQLADEGSLKRLTDRAASTVRTIDLKKRQLALANDSVERHRRSIAEGLTAPIEINRTEIEASGIAVDVQQAQTDLDDTKASADRIRTDVEIHANDYREAERSLREEQEKAGIRIEALRRELGASGDDRLVVRAPCSGTVLRLRVRSTGAVVQEGEPLLELACSGDRLQAEFTPPQSGAGMVRAGYRAKLLYDAFPFQRYGVRQGTVQWVSPTAMSGPDSAAFRAVVTLDEQAIIVRGRPSPLLAGMRGRGEVIIGRRSLISYAFEPLRQLKESLAGSSPKG